ncbi:MAG: STAS domain-containing protein [Desulfobulbaceae bacterium]|jgi:MFS superfamily sulfate permease-like transporter|nr:STAS domain-containing protein [Desulfobulbaceae bacterium]
MTAKQFLPFLDWFQGYSKAALRQDAIAGLTVALVLIPQSMAYAQLAGMPSYYGLYAALLPPIIAALFGSSRQLATGPVAVVSLMTSASLAPLATAGSAGYVAYALLLSLAVGIFQFLLGALRLGLVVNFLSHPVVNGFTNAGAIIIATSQLEKMFGVSVDGSEHYYQTIINVVKSAIYYTHWPTFIMGAGAFLMMFLLKKFAPKVPNVLVAVVLTTLISWGIGFQRDAKEPLATVQSGEIRQMVTDFNATFAAKEDVDKKAQEATALLAAAQKDGKAQDALYANYQLQLMAAETANIRARQRHIRSELRALLLSAVPQSDGNLFFYQKDEVPVGVLTDGHVWRLKVGNRQLDMGKLPFMSGGAVVGDVPKGLPKLSMPQFDLTIFGHLFASAIIISLLGFMEAISIAKALAAKSGQRLDPNQELIGQGLANILGSFTSAYPVSGSFSRSAVNMQAGAKSGLSSVFTGLIVGITLMFFTPLLYHLPQSVLAAVIMMAVIGLINVSGFVHAYTAKKYDGIISVITFFMTLAFAPHLDKGIMIGVGLSLAVFLYKSMRPNVSSLSRDEKDDLRDSVAHGLSECRYMDLIRFDGPLFFANASYLEDQIALRMQRKKDLRHLIIACGGMNDIDASGEEVLSLVISTVRSSGRDISFCEINETVAEVLERTHLLEKIGRSHIYSTMEKATCAVHELAHRNSEEEHCPLASVCYISR